MSKPDDIPADVWEAAYEVYDAVSEAVVDLYEIGTSGTDGQLVIARAILAERERCAKIAEEDIRSALAIDHQYKPTWFVRAEQIAKAIREPSPNSDQNR